MSLLIILINFIYLELCAIHCLWVKAHPTEEIEWKDFLNFLNIFIWIKVLLSMKKDEEVEEGV